MLDDWQGSEYASHINKNFVIIRFEWKQLPQNVPKKICNKYTRKYSRNRTISIKLFM